MRSLPRNTLNKGATISPRIKVAMCSNWTASAPTSSLNTCIVNGTFNAGAITCNSINEVELVINGTVSPAPEPSTCFLFAGGVAALAAFRLARRRRCA
jgi:hypothetical protein